MGEWGELLTNFGFPVVVSFYLLIRTENRMEKLTDAINALTTNMEKYYS